MMRGPWITNLENVDLIEDGPRKDSVRKDYAAVRIEKGDYVIGPPQSTQWRSAEEIAARGVVGVYMRLS